MKRLPEFEFQPFKKLFVSEFNKLPADLRKQYFETFPEIDNEFIDKFKNKLKTHFRKDIFKDGEKCDLAELRKSHTYCKKVVLLRKRLSHAEKVKRDHTTPIKASFRISGKRNAAHRAKILSRAPEAPRPKRTRWVEPAVFCQTRKRSTSERITMAEISDLLQTPKRRKLFRHYFS